MKSSRIRRPLRARLDVQTLETRMLMAADVTADLVHHWKFDESSGDVAADSVGTNHGSLIGWEAGENKFVKGRFGNAIDIDGANNLVQTSQTIVQDVYTFTFWIYRQGQGGLNPRLITAPAASAGGIIVNNERNEGVGFYSDGRNDQDPVPPAFDTWEHYAVEIDTVNNRNVVFKDGVQVAADDRPMDPFSFPLVFGHNEVAVPNDNEQWDGLIDDLRIYNRLLTSSEVVAVADYGKPVVSLTQASTYVENRAPLLIAKSATISALSTSFAGGKLTVLGGGGANPADELSIIPSNPGPMQVSVQGTDVRYAGTIVGTLSGGSGGQPLVVSLNENGTAEATLAILKQVAFRTVTDNPSTALRQILVGVDDGSGVSSRYGGTGVFVVAVADRPSLALGGSMTYTENQAPVALAPTATLFDPDSASFSKLLVRTVSSATGADRLDIQNQGTEAGQIGISGTDVTYAGVAIGSFSGGKGSQALQVNLNGNATLEAVQALVRNIRFETIGENPAPGTRTIRYVAVDDAGISSNLAFKTVEVVAVNDAPRITATGAPMDYAVQFNPAVPVFPTANIVDPDSADFAGGFLIAFCNPTHSNNELRVGSGFSESTNANGDVDITLDGTVIGTRTQNAGFGGAELRIDFTPAATKAVVQQLVRSLTFMTGSAGNRQVRLSINDGDGGQSAEVFRLVKAR